MLSKVKKGVELGRKLGQPAKKPPIKASEALGKHEGKTLMITETDRTKVGEGYLGGPGFSSLQLEDPFYRDVGAVWGVGKPSKASTMIAANRRLPEGEVIWSTFIGKPDQHKSNQMVFDSLLKEFKAANKAGNLPDELKDKINDRLASAIDKDGRPIFPADVDITSPKFRNLANTFDRRAVAASVMGGEGVGGKKGQIFDYESIIKSTTDPDLVDAPTGAVGNRLFTLSNEVIQRPDLHPAFPSILTGEDLDVNFSPVLRDLIMRDYIKSMMETKGRMPGQFDYTRGYAPMQLLDEAILTKMQKEGYAEGGKVDNDLKNWHEKNMAAGGVSKLVGALAKAGKKTSKAKTESVVNQERSPLRVYHGTTKGDITFEPRERGTYFTSDPELANEYTYGNFFRPGSEGAVYPSFLSMKNPMVIDAQGKRNDNIPFPGQEWKPKVFGNLPENAVSIEKAFKRAIEAGHDGLIVRNVVDSADRKGKTKGDVFVVQDPAQIRPAFGDEEIPEVPNPDITKAKGGAIDHDLKAWHEKNMSKGGEVRMSNGGASEFEGFFESGLPPSPIADEMLVGRGVRRKAPRIGEIFETPAQAVQGALGAFGSAGKGALQATVGLPGDIISLGRGVGAAVSPQPGEDRLGAFLRGMEGETGLPTTEDVKKFLDQYGKAPFEQFETLGEFTGIPILAAPKVSSAIGRAAEDVAPYLRDLPVGASIKPVGPGGEKVSVNELIRRLEAGEEMTPEEMQKAQYSKAQKEKYAQANIAKAQKEPAPKEEAVKVPANEMGFFSSVEKAAANLKREEGSGDAFLSDIMKFNPSAGELEATGIVDFLKGKKNVTRQEVQDYIDQHGVQIEEVTLGTILSDAERKKLNDINRKLSKNWPFPQRAEDIVTPEEEEWFEATKLRLQQNRDPRFEKENLILPGGKNYKEILLKFPQPKSQPEIMYKTGSDLREKINEFEALGFRPNAIEEAAKFIDQKGSVESALRAQDSKIARGYGYTRSEKDAGQVLRAILQGYKKQIDEAEKSIFRTDHWPDDPNTFMHLRMQDMTINGKKTLVIEEIQSDWHQTGRTKGYQTGEFDRKATTAIRQPGFWEVRDQNGDFVTNVMDHTLPNADEQAVLRFADLRIQKNDATNVAASKRVPNAPFKKDWYQLGVKRLLKYAADNDYDQVALVGPDEQIRRGSLGTHIDGLIYEKNADGTIKLMAEKGQSVVLDKTVEPKDLDLYVGKDVAKRILDSKETDGTLTGDDLKIGGEGMRQYYGRNYPEYMNKLGKKYGTEAKKTQYTIKEFDIDDIETVPTGEVDRYGREVMAYQVKDPDSEEVIAFDYDFGKVLKEANKKAPSTDMWLMDLPAKMKSDVKIGQPFKEGGAVTKDKDLMRWHKIQQLATGGAIKRLAESAKNKPWMKYAKSDKDKR